MLKRLWRENKGFTLMEIVIVIVILGILALLAIPRLAGFTEQAEIANDKEYAAIVARAAELYWASHDKTVPDIDDLDTGGSGLVGDSADELEYFPDTATVTIAITDGVAEVTIASAGLTSIVYDTVEGYTSTP